ncbi:hypothetical protein Tco_1454545 [Tanacetum coccineum]
MSLPSSARMSWNSSQRGRLANIMSFLVKISSAAEGEDTKRTFRDPKRRKTIGPCLAETLASVLKRGFFKRYRWPIMGIFGKTVGGRLENLCLSKVDMINEVTSSAMAIKR